MTFDIANETASVRQRRIVATLCAVVCLAVLATIPVASVQLADLPHISGVYGTGAAMIFLATFWLLISAHRPSYSHRIIASAYLYAGLMAILHVLTFPGALLANESVIGNSNTVSWLYIAWRAGFPVFILWAVGVDIRLGKAALHGSKAISPVFVAILAAGLGLAACLVASNVSALVPGPAGTRFSTPSVNGAYISAVVSAVTVSLICYHGLVRRSLYLWLVLVLLSESLCVWLSTYSGGRYTVAWYGARLEGILASGVVLALIANHFRRLQYQLVDSVEMLRQRTDALQAEMQHRERAERMLVQSQKLEAVGQLAAGLAHDINNFMQAIGVRAEMIRRRAGSLVEADVAVVQRNVRKAEQLTRQLLLVSGRRSLQPQQVRLQQLLPELIDSFRPVLGNKVTVKLSVPDDAWSVLLDPTELEVALANLLTNARDALDSEGAIVVSVANMAARSEDQAFVVIDVRDEGRGIPSAMLERVFEPFFTTKSPGKGTGLGLAQVYAFARASGGKVAVDSEVGQGTKVRIELPRDGDGTPRQEPDGSGSAPCLPAQGTNVLVVDDNADVAESTSLLLREVGCTVRTAASADQALLLMAGGPFPDVILSDIFMPGEMDGLALARQVRQRHPSVRIVLASGYSDAAAAAKKEGFVVLQKPYELPSMLRAVAQT